MDLDDRLDALRSDPGVAGHAAAAITTTTGRTPGPRPGEVVDEEAEERARREEQERQHRLHDDPEREARLRAAEARAVALDAAGEAVQAAEVRLRAAEAEEEWNPEGERSMRLVEAEGRLMQALADLEELRVGAVRAGQASALGMDDWTEPTLRQLAEERRTLGGVPDGLGGRMAWGGTPPSCRHPTSRVWPWHASSTRSRWGTGRAQSSA